MSFKTQKEIYEALIQGLKIARCHSSPYEFFVLQGGYIHNHCGNRVDFYFDKPELFSIYEEPKKMKTVTLYRYTYQNSYLVISQSKWTTNALRNEVGDHVRLLKTESKNLEIEDV